MAARLDHMDCLAHGRRRRAVIDHAVFGRLAGIGNDRARHQVLGGVELADQPLHVVDVRRPFLGVFGIAVARGTAGEEGALGRVRARIGAVGDAVAVDVEIAAEILPASSSAAVITLPRSYLRVSSQASGRDKWWFMPMSRSSMTKIGVCSRSARSKACAPKSKASAGSSGNSSTCLVSPCEA